MTVAFDQVVLSVISLKKKAVIYMKHPSTLQLVTSDIFADDDFRSNIDSNVPQLFNKSELILYLGC